MKLTSWEPDLLTIVDRIESGDIDLQPDFQRQEVWSPSKKKRLIDTVLRGWSIPPIHLVVTEDNRLEVLDGQQRLVAIRDFFANRLAIDGNVTPHDDSIRGLQGKFYRSLDTTTKRRVNQYALRCFRITDYQPDEPSELFYRLNQPTVLTAGEQRNALYGPAREQLKRLVRRFEATGNDKGSIGFSNARLAYDDILARLLFFLESGNFGVKGTEARISERFRHRAEFPQDVVSRARRSIRHFSNARDLRTSWRFNKASLLSWLIFFARFQTDDPNTAFMDKFFDASKISRAYVSDAVAVFDDRASLRVTDASSVMLRDFALWYTYFHLGNTHLPASIPSHPLEQVLTEMATDRDAKFEDKVFDAVSVEDWGVLL
ncbi:DUF262 domain-containing protein [Reyranella sp. CPCC 100927]|uniref:DUF262 domain-containing protein n=1 Tax=Reyranella sp. CPCC 100927 TaxID=2599616 RepID=UPI0011B3A5A8|nr:DUF262 domain-containing protein [Reyranella sp. CPCC 100927]TWS99696.1 DUF262 domain-containing protein [Reyranella sp. CPCC 100927]